MNESTTKSSISNSVTQPTQPSTKSTNNTTSTNSTSNNNPLSSFLAGIAGGSASTILLYPLDLVKVRMQVDERRRNTSLLKKKTDAPITTTNCSATTTRNAPSSAATAAADRPRTICCTVRGVIKHEGYLGLYRGLTPAIIGSATSWGGFFIIYEELKGQLLYRKRKRQQQQNESMNIMSNTSHDAQNNTSNQLTTSNTNKSSNTSQTQTTRQKIEDIKLGPIEHFTASCLSGACMVALTNPLWLIKTRLQLQNSTLLEAAQMKNVMQQSASASVVAATTSTAATIKGGTTATALSTSSATGVATTAAAAVQSQQQAVVKPPYKGLLHTATTIIQEEGILALYKGSIPALMLVSHGGIQFVTYEFLKGHFVSYFPTTNSKRSHEGTIRERVRDSIGYLVMGAASKFVASTTTYPLQVIKARLQQRSQSIEVSEVTNKVIITQREYTGVFDCIQRILKNEGMNGFFKGCLTNAIRVAPSAAITFVTYEFVLDMLT